MRSMLVLEMMVLVVIRLLLFSCMLCMCLLVVLIVSMGALQWMLSACASVLMIE